MKRENNAVFETVRRGVHMGNERAGEKVNETPTSCVHIFATVAMA